MPDLIDVYAVRSQCNIERVHTHTHTHTPYSLSTQARKNKSLVQVRDGCLTIAAMGRKVELDLMGAEKVEESQKNVLDVIFRSDYQMPEKFNHNIIRFLCGSEKQVTNRRND